jgi:CDP-diacylglycerol--serine O-phosphatidyltransferase
MMAVACLVTYPYATLAIASASYLAALPWTWQRFRRLEQMHAAPAATAAESEAAASPAGASPSPPAAATAPAPESKPMPRIVEIRPNDQKR